MMKLVYPACFYQDPETGNYTVEVPDLPGCVSGGPTLADAILMAEDAASGWVLDELEHGSPCQRHGHRHTGRRWIRQSAYSGYGCLCGKVREQICTKKSDDPRLAQHICRKASYQLFAGSHRRPHDNLSAAKLNLQNTAPHRAVFFACSCLLQPQRQGLYLHVWIHTFPYFHVVNVYFSVIGVENFSHTVSHPLTCLF